MAKFKVGDRVKSMSGDKEYIGAVGVIDLDDGSALPYRIKLDQPIEQWGDTHIWRTASTVELVPTWQPKVGDRVRLVKDGRSTKGAVGKLATVSSWGGKLIDNGEYLLDIDQPVDYKTTAYPKNLTRATIDCIEPLPVAAEAQPAALTITAGKFYKTRDGRKVGPAFIRSNIATFGELDNWHSAVWADDGRQSSRSDKTSELDNDIIAEWVDEPAAAVAASNDNAAPAKFKVGDRVRGKNCVGDDVDSVVYSVDDAADDDMPYLLENGGWCRELDLELATTSYAIVALIEDGQPKPATRPKIHDDQASATAEAERLALEHPGQLFGVFVLAGSKIADEVITKTAVLRAA